MRAQNGQVGCVTTAGVRSVKVDDVDPNDIRSGVVIAGVTGTASLESHTPCSAEGAIDCITTATFQSVHMGQLVASNIRSGVTIAGVNGSVVQETHASCANDGDVGCVVVGPTFKAADMSVVLPGNIRSGVSVAGVTGSYPSASAPLVSATPTTDLPGLSANTAAGVYEFFDSHGVRHTGSIADAGNIMPNTMDQDFSASLYRQFVVRGDADLNANNIKSGVNLFGADGVLTGATTQTFDAGLYRSVTVNGDANLVAANIKNAVSLFGVTGNVVPSAPACTSDGELGCVTHAAFLAADMANVIPSNVKDAVVIAGVTGSLSGTPVNCSANAEVGCVTTSTYRAANLTNLVAGNVKNGVTIAGVAGTYPSLVTPLAGASGTVADLTSMAAATPAGAYEFFDSTGARYTGSISNAGGGTITPGTSNQTFNASLYRQFTVAGDTDLSAGNIVAGAQIFNVTGTTSAAPASCSSDGQTACVATGTYKAANTGAFGASDIRSGKTVAGVSGTLADCAVDGGVGCLTTASYKAANMAQVSAGNIKAGVTIGGVFGDFPSVSYPLSGAGVTADLDATTFSAKIKSSTAFEYWDSTGARHANSGDGDIIATNIASGVNVFGIAGSVIAESHANCSADGGVGCVTTASYKAANMAQVTAGNLRSGVTIAGVLGDYPSATNRLSGNTGAADLDASTFSAKIKSSSAFEYWDSAGVRHDGGGDADIVAENIKNGKSIFGTVGTYSGPVAPPTGFSANVMSSSRIDLGWSGTFTGYLLVRRTGSAVAWTPTDGTSYSQGNLDGTHTVVYVGAATSFSNTGLSPATTYHYAVFGYDANGNFSQAALASAEIGYSYYRLYITSVNNDDWVMVSNVDFHINGDWASESISGNNGTIGGYSVTISGQVNNSFAHEAIDNSVSSGSYAWGTPNGHFSSSSPYNGNLWLKVQFPSPVVVKGLRIYGCHASCNTTANAPDRWRLEGSNDNSTWTTIPGSEVLTNTNTYKTNYAYTW